MKITNYALVFIIICMAIFFVLFINSERINQTESERIKFNNALDGATQDALVELVEYDSGDIVSINKDVGVSNFFQSLYSGLGCVDNPEAQEQLKLYVPLILVTELDGYHVYFNHDATTPTGRFIRQDWTEKIPYTYVYKHYIINFQIDNNITIFDTDTQDKAVGDYHDLNKNYSDIPFLASDSKFNEVRKSAIIRLVSDSMIYYVNMHNRLAHDYGITYQFYVPSVSDEDWNRTIDGIGMFIFFQGYPYRGTNGYFNRMEVAAAQLHKEDYYYINTEAGRNYYHRHWCTKVYSKSRPYETARECADLGAYPCPICQP